MSLEILLHVIVGAAPPQTMHVIGFLQNRPMVVLIDYESTHNFVDPSQLKGVEFGLIKEGDLK